MTGFLDDLLAGKVEPSKPLWHDADAYLENGCVVNGSTVSPVKQKEDLTHTWLSRFLNREIADDDFSVTPTGTGQMSSTVRVTFRQAGCRTQETLVVKFASQDRVTREMGLQFGHYLREAIFYRRFGDRLTAGLAKCYGAVVDRDAEFSIVLEDLGAYEAYTHGQLEGTDYEHALLALRALARLQAPVLGDATLDDDKWLNAQPFLNQKLFNQCYPIFLERHPPAPEHKKLLDWMAVNLDAWWATRKPPFCIFHGDFRLDNIMFLKRDGDRAVAMDWGDASWASPFRDAAYFLGNGLKIEDRRKWEEDLLREYLAELNRLGNLQISWDHAWEEYRRQSVYGLAQHIPAAGMLPDTDRGKIMFRTLVSRQAQHAIDLDAMSLVSPSAVFLPGANEEGVHVAPVDSGPLFNESWYFDAVSADGAAGIYARIGRLPNQDCCSLIAGIFRRGEAPVVFIEMRAPLPEFDSTVQRFATGAFTVESECLVPLQKFAFSLKGTGSSFDDPAAPLRGESGNAVEDVEISAIWQTLGQAYKKPTQTRYEIPCRVDGTVRIGSEMFSLNAAPGERNHSWGVRNWWIADWVWSGLHFEDGTQVFTIALGRGSDTTGASGFIQKDDQLIEITEVVNEFEFKENGMPGNLRLFIQPGDVTIECETVGEGGLRLLDPEGREAHLPRVMCRAKNNHGVHGVGWLDFNRVVKREPGP